MKARVRMCGKDLWLRIPAKLARAIGIADGNIVELSTRRGHPVVSPVRRKRYTLENLLAGITDENRHPVWETGAAVGNEAW